MQSFFAVTLLRARKLNQFDSDRPSPAKVAVLENAPGQAAFILECIDRKWAKRLRSGRTCRINKKNP